MARKKKPMAEPKPQQIEEQHDPGTVLDEPAVGGEADDYGPVDDAGDDDVRRLMCVLTPEEWEALSRRIAANIEESAQIRSAIAEHSAAIKGMRRQISQLETLNDELSRASISGEEMRPVRVRRVARGAHVDFVREDTHAVVDSRLMTARERQEDLFP